eukprot:14715953-Ditylum_brightwellii.AAC.1
MRTKSRKPNPVDPDSGLPYYLHTVDGITTWDRPTIADDSPAAVAKDDDHDNNNAKVVKGKMQDPAEDEKTATRTMMRMKRILLILKLFLEDGKS